MARDELPKGLHGAWQALAYRDSREVHDRLTTLVWLRMLADPFCPTVAGYDPRTVFDQPLSWLAVWDAEALNTLGYRVNELLGYSDLFSVGWEQLDAATVARAVLEIGRWEPVSEIGDQLGYVSQRIRSVSAKSGLGSFYTPYAVSLLMARMTRPQPGATVLDPCCGSGSMLLAAIQACREENGVDQVPDVYGIDIDPVAVRLCRLNLVLAGVHPGRQVECRDALLLDPELLTPIQRGMQSALFEYEAGSQIDWRQRSSDSAA